MTLVSSIVSFANVRGVIHAAKWSEDNEVVLVCTERKAPNDIWNPNHPNNAGKPKHLTCMGCIAEDDR